MISTPSRRSRTSGEESDDGSDLDVETEAAAVLQAAALADAQSSRMTPHASSPLAVRSARLLDGAGGKHSSAQGGAGQSKAHVRYAWFKHCVCCCVCGGRNSDGTRPRMGDRDQRSSASGGGGGGGAAVSAGTGGIRLGRRR